MWENAIITDQLAKLCVQNSQHYYYYTRLTASFPGQPVWAGTRKANHLNMQPATKVNSTSSGNRHKNWHFGWNNSAVLNNSVAALHNILTTRTSTAQQRQQHRWPVDYRTDCSGMQCYLTTENTRMFIIMGDYYYIRLTASFPGQPG